MRRLQSRVCVRGSSQLRASLMPSGARFYAPQVRPSIGDRLLEIGGKVGKSVRESVRLHLLKQLGAQTESIVVTKIVEKPVVKEVVVEKEVVRERFRDVPVYVDKIVETEKEVPVYVDKIVEKEATVHPLFGCLLVNDPHRQVYLCSLENLSNIPVWHRNRTFRHERAEEIASEQVKENGIAKGLPGVICLFQHRETNRSGIVDGQHRVGAMKILSASDAWNDAAHNILIEVYPVDTEEQVARLFSDINKAEPVKLIDLPEGSAGEAEKAIYDGAVLELSSRYPQMFSSSSRCRLPHLNVDNLRSDMFECQLIHRHELTSMDALLQWLLERNDSLGARTEEEWAAVLGTTKAAQRALKKANTNLFWLGLERNWM